MAPHAAQAGTLLRALANQQRLMILCLLSEAELSVGELNAQLPLSQSALSQHLAILREQGVVRARRDGQVIFYALLPGPAAQIVQTLHDIYCSVDGRDAPAP
ncbi:MAG: metalloregulator ArsR/SmtB family transcription factor [Steroidobacteraceae bacterium]